MLARGQQIGRHVDGVAAGLDRLDRGAGGDAPHDRNRDRTAAFLLRTGPHPAEISFDDTRRETTLAAEALRDRFGQLDHFDGARPVWKPPDEAALLKRHDQAMNAGFRAQIQSILHLVEGGRHSRLLQAVMDEAQKLELFAGQHRPWVPRGAANGRRRNKA